MALGWRWRRTPEQADPGAAAALASAPSAAHIQRPSGSGMARGLFALTLALGAAQAVVGRNVMNSDGISYLDLGDAIVRGDSAAINGYWSPLYAALQGAAQSVIHPSIRWDFSVVHLVNLLIFIGILTVFHFTWRRFLLPHPSPGVRSANAVPWSWMLVGYALFGWATLELLTVKIVTPDLLLLGFVYAACVVLDVIRRAGATWQKYALLGVILGFGYLSKAMLFPMSVVFLAVSAMCAGTGNWRRAARITLVASAAFAAVSAPWVASLSKQKGYLTYGLTGRLNYYWYVNSTPPFDHGPVAPEGAVAHPPRVIHQDPLVYLFPSPPQSSYPFWYDPSYWHEGVKPHFDPVRHVRLVVFNAQILFRMGPGQYVFLALTLFLLFLSPRTFLRSLGRQWHVWVPAACALMLYLLIYVEDRLAAPWLFLLFTAVMLAVMRGESSLRDLLPAVALTSAVLIGASVLEELRADFSRGKRDQNVHLLIAEALHDEGLRPGDRIGVIGDALGAYWLRLARLTVLAETPADEAGRFWAADTARQAAVLSAFRGAGVRAVVSDRLPSNGMPGWHRLADTDKHVYAIDLPSNPR